MKRATYIGFLFGLVILVSALVPLMDAVAQDVMLEVKCNETHCLMKREDLVQMIEAHNAHIEEINRLKKACGLKIERNS